MSHDAEYGSANPEAPPELSQFAFLIGRWRCDVRVRGDDGAWQRYEATWTGRYILDGWVIADEYRMVDRGGHLIVHGMNFRSYSAVEKTWKMRWLDATRALWVELGPESLGGVHVTPQSITFKLADTMAPDGVGRVTFSDISADHFTWREETSPDHGTNWRDFVVLEAHRMR